MKPSANSSLSCHVLLKEQFAVPNLPGSSKAHLKKPLAFFVLFVGVIMAPSTIPARADIFTIDAKSGPWEYASGGLNSAYQYGVNDQMGPTVVSSVSGFSLSAGQSITLTYQAGTVSGSSVMPFVDANGVTTYPYPDGSPHANGVFPSWYMAGRESICYVELVGTFANNQGQIVGSPFALGDGPTTIVVPANVSRLQLGVNDNLFADNRGSWSVSAELSTVPEPSTLGMLELGIIVLTLRHWRCMGGRLQP